ncbi:MAG: RNA-binding transcriptional accessory protein, partial [Muribaculaceae bacterium]|nr:RNA-binding transcriptional accessory protein [Muribaculaceae bacterium]
MEKEDIILRGVSARTGLPLKGVAAVIKLLDEGATVPFISRYRKELTGSMDEVAVRAVEAALKTQRELEARRDFIREAIANAEALDAKTADALDKASTMTELEDIYAPYKPKKRTRATIAREKGLEPLAKLLMTGRPEDCADAARRYAGKHDVKDVEEALAGASDIIAEWASEAPNLRNITRNHYRRAASIACVAAKGKEEELKGSPFAQYAEFSQSVRRIPSHQYLALRRAEAEGLVKVKYELPEKGAELRDRLIDNFGPRYASKECGRIIDSAVEDAAKRLLQPSVETEVSASLKEEADKVAIDIFAGNLRQLLLGAPLKGHRILAIDPGYRTGCKVVALDQQGNLLDDSVIYPVPPRNDFSGAHRTIESLIKKHSLDTVAIGNGTASRETEKFVKGSGLVPEKSVYVVSENGASVYSASDVARKEFPDKDVTVRGAVSIGRRLIDPLAELVKIDPKSIGVGQYQHDVDQAKLKDMLDYTVMSCVNAVGVDVNTASEQLLSYVSGIGPALAKNIVAYRTANGDFRTRKELKKVPRLGDKAYELSAGFLRIPGGDEPLDNTGIHPESYALVKEMAKSIGKDVSELPAKADLLDSIDIKTLADKGVGGLETMTDIITELKKPGRDPRTDDDNEAFTPGVEDFDSLTEGMVLPGIVNNITAFGAFVDLGIKENGLLHISKISKRRISSVGEVLKLGQRIEVKVIDIDRTRKRISLELIHNAQCTM